MHQTDHTWVSLKKLYVLTEPLEIVVLIFFHLQCVGSVSCYEMEALRNFQLLAPVLLLRSDISCHYCITVVLNQEVGAHYRVPQQTSKRV